ncbi:hypothetical protein KGE51_03405 [Lactobacillus amylovorus]|nr:hypothetical protein [Lactobacillus amylovorus]UIK35644.1 hypothetical protein KGE51_03405 [Lactobacillus amylovorus]
MSNDCSVGNSALGLATEADYENLVAAVRNANNIANKSHNLNDSTPSKKEAFSTAMSIANKYIGIYQYGAPTASTADIHKAILNLNTAANNLDGAIERAKMPKITIEVTTSGPYIFDWNSAQRNQALAVANEIYGSTDAHFIRLTDYHDIGLTDSEGRKINSLQSSDFVNATYIDAKTALF